jgi:acetyltransferase-like isoleucine patch superfamily enzyme
MGSGTSKIIKAISSPKYTASLIRRSKLQKKYKDKAFSVGLNSEIVNTSIGKYITIGMNVVLRNSSVGDHSYINSLTYVNNTQFGKFCSIGSNVQFGLGKHPTNMVSTHPAFFANNKNFKTYADKVYIDEYEPIVIGNDVWIGDGAVIMNGVTIEDGAVVAARAVVTKNVKAYSIVGGVPAKVLKFRFEEKLIERIRLSKWWDRDEEWFEANYKLFHDPAQFISHLHE